MTLYVLFVGTEGRSYYLAGLYAPLTAAGALGLQRRREPVSAALAVVVLALSISLTCSDVGEPIARRTSDVLHALPAAQQSRTAIVGESYIVAAYLDGSSHRYRLPEARGLSRSYGYFAPPQPELDTVLYVGRDPGPLRPYFDGSQLPADIGDDMHAYLLTGQRLSWATVWPRERTLTVS